jgi:hypothetical protein
VFYRSEISRYLSIAPAARKLHDGQGRDAPASRGAFRRSPSRGPKHKQICHPTTRIFKTSRAAPSTASFTLGRPDQCHPVRREVLQSNRIRPVRQEAFWNFFPSAPSSNSLNLAYLAGPVKRSIRLFLSRPSLARGALQRTGLLPYRQGPVANLDPTGPAGRQWYRMRPSPSTHTFEVRRQTETPQRMPQGLV